MWRVGNKRHPGVCVVVLLRCIASRFDSLLTATSQTRRGTAQHELFTPPLTVAVSDEASNHPTAQYGQCVALLSQLPRICMHNTLAERHMSVINAYIQALHNLLVCWLWVHSLVLVMRVYLLVDLLRGSSEDAPDVLHVPCKPSNLSPWQDAAAAAIVKSAQRQSRLCRR